MTEQDVYDDDFITVSLIVWSELHERLTTVPLALAVHAEGSWLACKTSSLE